MSEVAPGDGGNGGFSGGGDITGGTGIAAPSEGYNVGPGYSAGNDVGHVPGGGIQAGDPGFINSQNWADYVRSYIFTGNDSGTVSHVDPNTHKVVTEYQEPNLAEVNNPAELVSREFTFFGNGSFRSPGQILPGGKIIGDTMRTPIHTAGSYDRENPTAQANLRTDNYTRAMGSVEGLSATDVATMNASLQASDWGMVDAYTRLLNSISDAQEYARANPYHEPQQYANDQNVDEGSGQRAQRQYQPAGPDKIAYSLTGVNPVANFRPETGYAQVDDAIRGINNVVAAGWQPFLSEALIAQGYTLTASGFVPPAGISTDDFNAGIGRIWESFVAANQGVFDNYQSVTAALQTALYGGIQDNGAIGPEVAQAMEMAAGQSLNVGHPLILPLVNADIASQFISTISRPGNIVAVVPQNDAESVKLQSNGWVPQLVQDPNNPISKVLAMVPPSVDNSENAKLYGLTEHNANIVSRLAGAVGIKQGFEAAYNVVVPVLADAFKGLLGPITLPGPGGVPGAQVTNPLSQFPQAMVTPLFDIPSLVITGKTIQDHVNDGTLPEIAVAVSDQVNLANIAMALIFPEVKAGQLSAEATARVFVAQTAGGAASQQIGPIAGLPQEVQDLLAMGIFGHISNVIPNWRTAFPEMAASFEKRIDQLTQGTSNLVGLNRDLQNSFFSTTPMPGGGNLKREIENVANQGILGGRVLSPDAQAILRSVEQGADPNSIELGTLRGLAEREGISVAENADQAVIIAAMREAEVKGAQVANSAQMSARAIADGRNMDGTTFQFNVGSLGARVESRPVDEIAAAIRREAEGQPDDIIRAHETYARALEDLHARGLLPDVGVTVPSRPSRNVGDPDRIRAPGTISLTDLEVGGVTDAVRGSVLGRAMAAARRDLNIPSKVSGFDDTLDWIRTNVPVTGGVSRVPAIASNVSEGVLHEPGASALTREQLQSISKSTGLGLTGPNGLYAQDSNGVYQSLVRARDEALAIGGKGPSMRASAYQRALDIHFQGTAQARPSGTKISVAKFAAQGGNTAPAAPSTPATQTGGGGSRGGGGNQPPAPPAGTVPPNSNIPPGLPPGHPVPPQNVQAAAAGATTQATHGTSIATAALGNKNVAATLRTHGFDPSKTMIGQMSVADLERLYKIAGNEIANPQLWFQGYQDTIRGYGHLIARIYTEFQRQIGPAAVYHMPPPLTFVSKLGGAGLRDQSYGLAMTLREIQEGFNSVHTGNPTEAFTNLLESKRGAFAQAAKEYTARTGEKVDWNTLRNETKAILLESYQMGEWRQSWVGLVQQRTHALLYQGVDVKVGPVVVAGSKNFDVNLRTGLVRNITLPNGANPHIRDVINNPKIFNLNTKQLDAVNEIRQLLVETKLAGLEGGAHITKGLTSTDLLPKSKLNDPVLMIAKQIDDDLISQQNRFLTQRYSMLAAEKNGSKALTELRDARNRIARDLKFNGRGMTAATRASMQDEIAEIDAALVKVREAIKVQGPKHLQGRGPENGVQMALDLIKDVNSALRATSATLDLSWLFIQGLPALGRNPVGFAKAALGTFYGGTFGSFFPALRNGWIEKHASELDQLLTQGLAWAGHNDLNEFQFMDRWMNWIPGVKTANWTFTEFGNRMRFELARGAMNNHRIFGYSQTMAQRRELLQTVNKMTGIGSKPTEPERFVEFAARFFRSQLGLIADGMTKFRHVDPTTGARVWGSSSGIEARRALTGMIGLATAMTFATNAALGNETDINPMSPNFMRIRALDRDWSLFGPWDTLFRAASSSLFFRGVSGEDSDSLLNHFDFDLARGGAYLLRSKASPVLQIGWDIVQGATNFGRTELDGWGTDSLITMLLGRLPFGLQDFTEANMPKLPGSIGEVPGFVKEFVMTNPAEFIQLMGFKSSPLSNGEKAHQILADKTAEKLDYIKSHPESYGALDDDAARSIALTWARTDPEYREAREKVVADGLKRGEPWAQISKAHENIRGTFGFAQQEADKALAAAFRSPSYDGRNWEQRIAEDRARIDTIRREIALSQDSDKVNKLEDARDNNYAAISGTSAALKSLSGQMTLLLAQKNELSITYGTQDARLREALTRQIDDKISKIRDQMEPLSQQLSGLSASNKALTAERTDIKSQLAPVINALYDELDALYGDPETSIHSASAGIRTWENYVRAYDADQKGRSSVINSMYQAIAFVPFLKEEAERQTQNFAGVKAIINSNDWDPKAISTELDKAGENRVSAMKAAVSAIYDKHEESLTGILSQQNEQGRYNVYGSIELAIQAFRDNLSPSDRLLYDMTYAPNTDRYTPDQLALRSAKDAVFKDQGNFYGVDVRGQRGEYNLINAFQMAAERAGVGDNPLGVTYGQGIQQVQALVDRAIRGDTKGVASAIADVVGATGASVESINKQFRGFVADEISARSLAGAKFTDERGRPLTVNQMQGATLADLTDGNVYRAMNVPPPPPMPAGQRQVTQSQIASVDIGKTLAQGMSGVVLPAPPGAPVAGPGMPIKDTTGLSVEDITLRDFRDIINEDYFGKTVGGPDRQTLNFAYEDLAGQVKDSTVKYMFENHLSNSNQIKPYVLDLISKSKDNPEVKALMMANPQFRAILNDEDAKGPTRNYIIALDALLRANNGEDVISDEEAEAGFKATVKSEFFRQAGTSAIPQVKDIERETEKLMNDTRLITINDALQANRAQVRLESNYVRLGTQSQSQADANIARLDAEYQALLDSKGTFLQERTARLDQLEVLKAAITDLRPPPPGDAIYTYLLSKNGVDRVAIGLAVKELSEANKENPLVQNVGAFLAGRAPAGTTLQNWMDQRLNDLKAAESLRPASMTHRSESQLLAQVRADVRDIYAANYGIQPDVTDDDRDIAALNGLRPPMNPTSGATYITGGSLLIALQNAFEAGEKLPLTEDLGFTRAGGGLSSTARPLFPRTGSGGTKKYEVPGQQRQQFGGSGGSSFTSGGFAPRTSAPRVSGGGGSASTRPSASSITTSSAGTVQTWEEFRQAVQTITGSGRTTDIFERAAATGRAVTDPKATRELQMLYRTIHVGGAKNFNEWLAALRQLYLPRLLIGNTGSSGDAANREIRTRRSP